MKICFDIFFLLQADPIDAGTDNGFTFTAPNWPTTPQASMFKITHDYPAHPAGSFNYPEKKSLPPIATFKFVKEKEYELSEVFNLESGESSGISKYSYKVENSKVDDSILTFVPSQSEEATESVPEMSNEIESEQDKQTESDLLSAVKMNPAGKVRSFRSGYHSSGSPTDFLKKKYNSAILEVSS